MKANRKHAYRYLTNWMVLSTGTVVITGWLKVTNVVPRKTSSPSLCPQPAEDNEPRRGEMGQHHVCFPRE